MANNGGGTLHAYTPLLLVPILATGAGSGTVAESKASVASWVLPMIPWAGSALMAAVGAVGVLLVAAVLRPWRLCGLLLVGYLLDLSLSVAFVWPIRDSVVSEPLALWPYVLTTATTFLAAMTVGFIAPHAALRLGLGIVCVDLLLSGLLGFFVPQAASWKLVTRVIAAFGAAGVGALLGGYMRAAMRRDRYALGRFFAAFALASLASATGGVIAHLFLK